MTTEWEQPLVSVDVVPVWKDGGQVWVGLGYRLHDPHIGELALPGVLMGRERSTDAARRALRTKVGITATAEAVFVDVGVFDNPERDPRGPTLSIAKLALLQSGAVAGSEVATFGLDEAPRLPFDHGGILAAAKARLSGGLWTDPVVARGLLGEGTFTTSDVTTLHAALMGEKLHPSNVRRRLETTGWAKLTGESRTPSAGRGRPSAVWRWIDRV